MQWDALSDRGCQAFQFGRLELAEDYYWKAVQRAKAFDEFDPRLAASLSNLAVVLRSRGRFQQVESLFNLALRIWRALVPEHLCMAVTLNNAAGYHLWVGNYAEARQLFRKALNLLEHRRQPEDYLLAACLSNFARLYTVMEKFSQAESLYKRTRRLSQQLLGKDHHKSALVACGMGDLYRRLGKYSRADSLLATSLELLQRTQGPRHPDVATCLVYLGDLYYDQSATAGDLSMGPSVKRESVEPLYRAALQIRERNLGITHPDCADIYRKLASTRLREKDFAQAELFLRRSLGIYLDSLGPYHLGVILTLEQSAEMMRGQGKMREARELDKRVAQLRVKQKERAKNRISVLED